MWKLDIDDVFNCNFLALFVDFNHTACSVLQDARCIKVCDTSFSQSFYTSSTGGVIAADECHVLYIMPRDLEPLQKPVGLLECTRNTL